MIGFASYAPFFAKGSNSNIDDCVSAMDYLINIVGEDQVGIGTDWVQDQDISFFNIYKRIKVLGDM